MTPPICLTLFSHLLPVRVFDFYPQPMEAETPLSLQPLTTEIQRLHQQALDLLDADPAHGLKLLQQAFQLAENHLQQDDEHLQAELAACTITRGRLNLKNAAYTAALTDFQTAMQQFERLGKNREKALARSYYGIAYAHMGEFADALEHLFQALKEVQELGDQLLTAEITNDICYTYVLLGQPELAIPHLHQAVQTLRELNEPMRLSWALDSLAMAYLHTGQPRRAMEYETEAIQIAEAIQTWQDQAVYLNNIGEIYLAMGDDSAAISAYQRALNVARQYNLTAEIAITLLNLGKLHTERGHYEAAEKDLNEALLLAQQTRRQQQVMEAYRALADLYEKNGKTAAALEMYKKYHAVFQAVYDQEADRRIKHLQVLHQLETLRRETEAFQKQALELQRKVEEQQRTQVKLEKLARTDSLTQSLNRRALFDTGQAAFQEARKTGQPLTIIMFDLDNFKEINDQYGHLVGDQVLTILVERIRHRLRSSDTLARYGGEEFTIIMPGITLEQGLRMAERVRGAVAESPIRIGGNRLNVTISLGVATASPPHFPHTFKELLRRADQALYAAKNSGRNCVKAFEG